MVENMRSVGPLRKDEFYSKICNVLKMKFMEGFPSNRRGGGLFINRATVRLDIAKPGRDETVIGLRNGNEFIYPSEHNS